MRRLRHCPASRRLAETVPTVETIYAREGTQAHAIAAEIAIARRDGQPEPDLYGAPEEMVDVAQSYVDHVFSLTAGDPNAVQLFEHRFDLSDIYRGCFGTADNVTWLPRSKTLVVADFKYGAGVHVSAERNDQLMYYGLGALHSMGWNPDIVELHIVQPRYDSEKPVDTWSTTGDELWAFAGEIQDICKETEKPDARMAAGDWCRFCPALAADICPLHKQKRHELSLTVFKDVTKENFDVRKLSDLLVWGPRFEEQLSAVREYAYNFVLEGGEIPGFKLVQKESRRAWRDEKEAAREIFEAAGRNIGRTEMVFLSPNEVEKLPANNFTIPKTEVKALVKSLVMKKSSGYALVPDDDARPAVKKIEAKQVFRPTDELDVYS